MDGSGRHSALGGTDTPDCPPHPTHHMFVPQILIPWDSSIPIAVWEPSPGMALPTPRPPEDSPQPELSDTGHPPAGACGSVFGALWLPPVGGRPLASSSFVASASPHSSPCLSPLLLLEDFSEFLEERSLEDLLTSTPVTKLALPGTLPHPPRGPAAPGPPGTWGSCWPHSMAPVRCH